MKTGMRNIVNCVVSPLDYLWANRVVSTICVNRVRRADSTQEQRNIHQGLSFFRHPTFQLSATEF